MYAITQHASSRMTERRVSLGAIELLLKFGDRRIAKDGRFRIVLSKSGAKRARKYLGHAGSQLIDDARRFTLITDEHGQNVVTVIPDHARQYRDDFRPWRVH